MAADSSMTARRRTKENDGAVSARYKKNAPKDGEKKKTAAKPAEKKPAQKAADKAIRNPEKKTDAKARPKTDKEKTAKKPAGEGRASSRRTSSAAAHAAPPSPRRGRLTGETDELAAPRRVARRKEEPEEAAPRRIARRKEEPVRRESGRDRREKKRMDAIFRDRRRAVSRGVDMAVVLVVLLTVVFDCFGLLLSAVRAEGMIDTTALRILCWMAPLAVVTALILPRFCPIDPLVMALTNFLCGVGVVILYTVSPDRGMRQATFYVLGLAAMLVISFVVARVRRFRGLTWLAMVLGIGALIMPLAFGQWVGGAKNWVNLPVIGSFQPSEMVKLSLVLAMAYYFSAHRTVFQMMPAIVFAGACLLLLMLQRDLGTALVYYMTTLAMFYVACGNVPLTLIGLGGGAGAAVMGYKMFAHVKVRVAMWRNPWSDPLDKGYQIIQALLAIGSGGLFGVGLGQGTPDKIPAYYNDFIFAVICEQMGLVFGLLLLVVYLVLILRGVSLITRSRRSLHMLLGCGVLVMLGVQTFMIVAGVIKMIPLTGVTMPFLSYGGSSLLSCLSMIGIVHGIAGRAQADMEEDVLSLKN